MWVKGDIGRGVYSEVGDMLVVGGIGAPRIQSASHGAPGGHGGAGNSARHRHPPITQTSAEERKGLAKHDGNDAHR